MKRPIASALFVVVTVVTAPAAVAQQASPSIASIQLGALAPLPASLSPFSVGEPSGGGLDPWLVFQPLRLSLTSTIFPIGSSFPQCEPEASGNTVNGFPVQHWLSWRVLPRLSLHAFSSLGCPIDGGLGGGVTYTSPLSSSLWLVGSAGAYAIPPRPPVLPARTSAEVRLDLMKQTNTGRTFQFGLEHKTGTGVTGVPVMVTFGMAGF
jgi:hypothetical protein